jgi:hypothetical protein
LAANNKQTGSHRQSLQEKKRENVPSSSFFSAELDKIEKNEMSDSMARTHSLLLCALTEGSSQK